VSRTSKGAKPPGYDYWSRRPGNHGAQGHGPDVKRRTHRKERRLGDRELRKEIT
jgi:hypothetical protein